MLDVKDRLRHELAGEFARESIAYIAIVPEEGLMALVYSWVDGQDRAGYAVAVFEGGPEPALFKHAEGLPAAGLDFDTWSVGDLEVAVGADLDHATARYDDDDIGLDIAFAGVHEAFDYERNEKGCPAYQATNRYEQGGIVTGTLRWRGRTIALDGPGHMDHSWGRRDWDAVHHYKWLAVTGRDRAANVMIALVEGEVLYNGYVFSGGVLAGVTWAEVDTTYDGEFIQERLTATVTDDAGRTTVIDFPRRFASAKWDVTSTFTFRDGTFTGTLDGGEVRAYVQYAWPIAYLEHIARRGPIRTI